MGRMFAEFLVRALQTYCAGGTLRKQADHNNTDPSVRVIQRWRAVFRPLSATRGRILRPVIFAVNRKPRKLLGFWPILGGEQI